MLYRLALVCAVALTACDQTDNNRPAIVEYITEAILAPSCAQDVCHSSYRMERGYAFDTVENAKRSLRPLVNPDDPQSSLLYVVLTRKVKRMPYDAPLPQKDIDLILLWIQVNAKTELGL